MIWAKDWIFELWDILYGYVINVYVILRQIYDVVPETQSKAVGFFEDLGDKIIDKILDIVPW
jgi:hypothetical protein